MNEADVTIKWKNFLQKHKPLKTETYELKLVNLDKEKNISFDRLLDHQYLGLMTSLEGLWHKIADTVSSNGGSRRKPFDAIWVKAYEAFVVVIFYKSRAFTNAYKIPIKNWIRIKNEWKNKSIGMEDLEKQRGVEKYYL